MYAQAIYAPDRMRLSDKSILRKQNIFVNITSKESAMKYAG
jgi:hypothetical protein